MRDEGTLEDWRLRAAGIGYIGKVSSTVFVMPVAGVGVSTFDWATGST